MRLSTGELLDRLAILLIKKENNLNVGKELKRVKRALWFRKYDPKLAKGIYNVNRLMWDLEEDISKTKSNELIGQFYKQLRNLTVVRAQLKNEPKTY